MCRRSGDRGSGWPKTPEQAKTVAVRCDRLPFEALGQEGVDSPRPPRDDLLQTVHHQARGGPALASLTLPMRRGEANSWGVQDIHARAFPLAHPRPSPGREEKPAAPAEIQSECGHAMDYVANQTAAPADLQALSERMKGLEPSTFCMASTGDAHPPVPVSPG
jgi:hypothetical protein